MATFHIHEDYNNIENSPIRKSKHYFSKDDSHLVKKIQEIQRVAFNPINQMVNIKQQETKFEEIHHKLPVGDKKKNNGECDLPKDVLQVTGRTNDIKTRSRSFNTNIDEKEYEEDIWRYLLLVEKRFQSNPNYMLKQMYINWDMRSILIDWLSTVAEEYKMNENTFHLTVNYIDRFLCNISVIKEKFQLVGAAAMLIAGKVDEIYPPDTKEWSYLTGDTFTIHQILKMEQLILKVLQFNVHAPTILDFIKHLCAKHQMDKRIMHLAMYLSELVLLEGKDYLQHYPSELAASSIALARHTLLHHEPWNKKLEKSIGLSLKQLSPVIKKQHKTFKSSPFKEQQSIQLKYGKEKYHKVSLLKPRVLRLDDEE